MKYTLKRTYRDDFYSHFLNPKKISVSRQIQWPTVWTRFRAVCSRHDIFEGHQTEGVFLPCIAVMKQLCYCEQESNLFVAFKSLKNFFTVVPIYKD